MITVIKTYRTSDSEQFLTPEEAQAHELIQMLWKDAHLPEEQAAELASWIVSERDKVLAILNTQ